MISEKMIKIFFEGVGGSTLLVIFNLAEMQTLTNIICHVAVTSGTLFLMYKQYKKQNPK